MNATHIKLNKLTDIKNDKTGKNYVEPVGCVRFRIFILETHPTRVKCA